MTAAHPDVDAAADLIVELAPYAHDLDAAGALAAAIYQWYVRSAAQPDAVDSGGLCPFVVSPLAALRAAHPSTARFEGGWRAESVSTFGRVVAAAHGGKTRVLDRVDYDVARSPGGQADPGDALLVTSRVDWVDDGWWYTQLGSWPVPDAAHIDRVYVNVRPAGVPAAVRWLLTGAGLGADLVLKVAVANPASGRADRVVVACPPGQVGAARELLVDPPGPVACHVAPLTPRFTERIRGGIGYAQGSPTGASFGDDIAAAMAAHTAAAIAAHTAAAIEAHPATGPLTRREARAAVATALGSIGRTAVRPWVLGGNP